MELNQMKTALRGLLIPAALVLIAVGVVQLTAITSTADAHETPAPETQSSIDSPDSEAEAKPETISAVASTGPPASERVSDRGAIPADGDGSRTLAVQPGDTLLELLSAGGLSHNDAVAVSDAMSQYYRPTRIRPGQELRFIFQSSDQLSGPARIEVTTSAREQIVVTRSTEGVQAERIESPLETREVVAEGRVLTSLYAAGRDAGLSNVVLMQLIGLLAFEVDFQRQIHPGDRFRILYEERYTEEGDFVETGELLAAEIELRHDTIRMYRFADRNGRTEYYDADGTTIRKTLLRTPIDGARITSGYGYRRHPIRGYSHLHRGIDFAGPIGTPVYAAGTGEIVRLRFTRGYGNHLVIRHRNGYQTLYAHMNGFARGIGYGQSVEQGQLIGYLGNTGVSTGPHLHYEVYYNGRNVNPASLDFPPERRLDGESRAAFRALRDAVDRTFYGSSFPRPVITR